jgi:hypothetical protein
LLGVTPVYGILKWVGPNKHHIQQNSRRPYVYGGAPVWLVGKYFWG